MRRENNAKTQISKSVACIKKLFKDDLLGIYQYGSSILDGLQRYSDIDLLVILSRPISKYEKSNIIQELLSISGIYMKDDNYPLEVTIVQKPAINPWSYPPVFEFQYGEWLRDRFENNEVDLWDSKDMPDLAIIFTQVLLSHKVLYGTSPEEVLPKVPYKDFISAMTVSIPELMNEIESDTRNVLLTLCRIWNTISTNKISSKAEAANWAISNLADEHKVVIERARKIYQGKIEEYWSDLHSLVKPCAVFIVQKINIKLDEINVSDNSDNLIIINL